MYTTSYIPFHPFLVMRTTASCTMYTVSEISTHYTPSNAEDSVAQWYFFCFIRRRTRVQFPFRIVPLFKVFFSFIFFYSYCLNVLIKCSLHFVCGFFFCQLFFFIQWNEIAWITTGQVQCIVRKAGWLNWHLSITFSYIREGTYM